MSPEEEKLIGGLTEEDHWDFMLLRAAVLGVQLGGPYWRSRPEGEVAEE